MASINLTGLRKDFRVHQGNDIHFVIELFDSFGQPLDMTGYSVCSEWRYASTDKVAITLTLANEMLSWKDQTGGKLNVHVPASKTSALSFKDDPDSLELKYDVEFNSNSPNPGTFKPQYGTVTLMRENTRIV